MGGFSGGGGLSEDVVLLLDGSNIMTGPIKTSDDDKEIQSQTSSTINPDDLFPGSSLDTTKWDEISDAAGGSVTVTGGYVEIDGNRAYNSFPQESIKAKWTITGDYDVRCEGHATALAAGAAPRMGMQMVHVAEEGTDSLFTNYGRASHNWVAIGHTSGSILVPFVEFNSVQTQGSDNAGGGTWFQLRLVRSGDDITGYWRWASTQGDLPDLDDNTGWTQIDTANYSPSREAGRLNLQVAANTGRFYEFDAVEGTAVADEIGTPLFNFTNVSGSVVDERELVRWFNGALHNNQVLFFGSTPGIIGSPQGDSTEPVITLGGNQDYSTAPLLHVRKQALLKNSTSDPEFEIESDGALNWPKAPQGDQSFYIDPAGGQVKFVNGGANRGLKFDTTRLSLADRDLELKGAGAGSGTVGAQVYMEVDNNAYQIWLGSNAAIRGALRIGADTSAPERTGIIEMRDESDNGNFLFIGPDRELRLHTSDPGEDDTSGRCLGPSAYGGMYVNDGVGSQTISSGSPATVNQWTADMDSFGVTPDSTTNNDITIDRPGTYLVMFQISFSGTANSTWEFWVDKNAGTDLTMTHCRRALGSSGDVGSCSAAAVVELAANDVLVIKAEPDGTSQDCAIEEGQFFVEQIC